MQEIDESTIKVTSKGIVISDISESPDRHTEDIQEIITKVPSWIVRWGIALFFGILLIVVAISVLVSYPEMIKVPLKLQSSGHIVSVGADTAGKITKVFVRKDQLVKNGQPLIEIQTQLGKNPYILRSPQDGRIGFSAIIQKGIMAETHQEMFKIHPFNEHFFGVLYIKQYDLGKIREGQDVLINLNNHPSEQDGTTKGKIDFIADEPVNDLFLVKVAIDGLNSNNNIRVKSWMKFDAQIITERSSAFHKILSSLKDGYHGE